MNARRRTTIDRERLKAVLDLHPGIPAQQRLEMIIVALIDALADEIEGK